MVAADSKSSKLTQFLQTFRDTIYTDIGPGPKLIPMRYIINLFKGFTAFWVYFLMYYYDNYSTGMYLYLFLHGTYGIFWLVKDILTPDASFKQSAKFGSLVILTAALVFYWTIPLTIAMSLGIQEPSFSRSMVCVILYIGGVVLMMGSDVYKNRILAIKKGLISDGFFSRTRNPNYLGEVMIYGSFAICSGFWLSYAIVMTVWFTLFAINIHLKEQLSYKHKKGWDSYKKQSYVFFPKILPTDLLNIVLYAAIIGCVFYFSKDSQEVSRLRELF